MFDLLKYKDNTAVITDRGESLTYSKLQKEVDEFYAHIPEKGLNSVISAKQGVF